MYVAHLAKGNKRNKKLLESENVWYRLLCIRYRNVLNAKIKCETSQLLCVILTHVIFLIASLALVPAGRWSRTAISTASREWSE